MQGRRHTDAAARTETDKLNETHSDYHMNTDMHSKKNSVFVLNSSPQNTYSPSYL